MVKAVSANRAAVGRADPQNSRTEHLFPTPEALSVRLGGRERHWEFVHLGGRYAHGIAHRPKRADQTDGAAPFGIAAYLGRDVLTEDSQRPYASDMLQHCQSTRNAQRRQRCKHRKAVIPATQTRADTCQNCKSFCVGSLWGSMADVAADLETTQAPYHLDLEWWAVQGSNL